ncbi:MAG: hypothetical protein WCL21_07405 [Mariniphaga sp.]
MKTIFKNQMIIFLMIISVQFVQGQEDDFISRLKTQLLLYRTQKIHQNIVVQTDKTFYRQGEKIWMKGYVTDAITHSLSLQSLVLAVQLSDDKGVSVSDGKYALKNGVADFSFSIPADLPSDIYHLVAYTPEMESSGIRSVFKKKIIIARPENLDMIPHIEYSKPYFSPENKEFATLRLMNFNGKPLSGKKFDYQILSKKNVLLSGKGKTAGNGSGEVVFITPSVQNGNATCVSLEIPSVNDRLKIVSKIPLSSEKINITFYPEGGRMVPGIPQTVIYEAKDQLGSPVDIKADIIDERGNIVVNTATISPGFGAFSLLNAEKEQFKMKIISDIGMNQLIDLPALSSGSMSISVKKNDGKTLSLLLGRSPKTPVAKFKIVAVTNGELIWASNFKIEQAGILNVPLDNFHSEIAAVAIFNDSGSIVAQRLIRTGKSQVLNISLIPNKISYKTGEEGEFKVKITGPDGKPVSAELAAGLSDKYTFPASYASIKYLNFGLDKPFPFEAQGDSMNKIAFDYYLATNTLKGYDLNSVVGLDLSKSLNFTINGIQVSGKVFDMKDLPVPNALVSLSSSSLQQFSARSDLNGDFVISLPVSVDKKNLTVSATDSSGKGNFRVALNKDFREMLVNSMDESSVNNWQIFEQLDRTNYFKNNTNYFKARPPLRAKNGEGRAQEPYWKKYLKGSSNLIEILQTIRPFELLKDKIVFRGRNSLLSQDGALIVIDGQKMGSDASRLSIINTQDIEDIQILLDPVEMGRYTSLNSVGVIEITTKKGGQKDFQADKITEEPKESSSKLFIPEAIGNEKYDLKTTLQWIPVLFTDQNGEATIPFKTGGIKSIFVLEIAGFTDFGQWIGSSTEIRVD